MAVTQMVRDEDFRPAVFVLVWRGLQVGALAFCSKEFPSLDPQSDTATLTTLLVSSPAANSTDSNRSTLLVPGALGEPEIVLAFMELVPLHLLKRYGVFISVIGTLWRLQGIRQTRSFEPGGRLG